MRSSWRSRSVTVAVEQLAFGVQAAQLEVVDGHLGMQAQVHVGLGGVGLGFSRAASTVRRMRPQKSGSQLAWALSARSL